MDLPVSNIPAPVAIPDPVAGFEPVPVAGQQNVPSVMSPPVAPNSPTTPTPQTPSGSVSVAFSSSTSTKKEGRGKELFLLGVLILLLAGAIFGFTKVRSLLSSASDDCSPESLVEENLTPNSIEVVFSTSKACQVSVGYGTSAEAMLLQVPEVMTSLNHRVKLSPLLPSTTYYYQVIAAGEKVGEVRSFLTTQPAKQVVLPTVDQQAGVVSPTRPVVVPTGMVPTVSQTQGTPTVPVSAADVIRQNLTGTPAASRYKITDFEKAFGTSNVAFDTDKNGVVNIRDWLVYQGQSI